MAEEKGLTLCTILLHNSGQWIKSMTPIISTKQNDPQAMGSAMTYARRYALAAISGVTSDEDDDGNEASQPAAKAENKPATLPAQAPAPKPAPASAPKPVQNIAFTLGQRVSNAKNLGEVKAARFDALKASKNKEINKEEADKIFAAIKEAEQTFEAGEAESFHFGENA